MWIHNGDDDVVGYGFGGWLYLWFYDIWSWIGYCFELLIWLMVFLLDWLRRLGNWSNEVGIVVVFIILDKESIIYSFKSVAS